MAYNNIVGSTDSECIFSMLLDALPDRINQLDICTIATAVEETISKLSHLCSQVNLPDGFSFNISLTDGVHIVATRFRNDHKEPPSLYYTQGQEYCKNKGNFICHSTKSCSEIIIASAPLNHNIDPISSSPQQEYKYTAEATPNYSNQWKLIPKNNIILVEGDSSCLGCVKNIQMRPINSELFVNACCFPNCPLPSWIFSTR